MFSFWFAIRSFFSLQLINSVNFRNLLVSSFHIYFSTRILKWQRILRSRIFRSLCRETIWKFFSRLVDLKKQKHYILEKHFGFPIHYWVKVEVFFKKRLMVIPNKMNSMWFPKSMFVNEREKILLYTQFLKEWINLVIIFKRYFSEWINRGNSWLKAVRSQQVFLH